MGRWLLSGLLLFIALVRLMSAGLAADKGLEIMRDVERRALADSQSYEGAIEVLTRRGRC